MIEVKFKRSDPNKTFCIYFKTIEDGEKFREFLQELINEVKKKEANLRRGENHGNRG